MQRSEEDENQRSKEDKNQPSEEDENQSPEKGENRRRRTKHFIISIVVGISQLSIASSGIAFTCKLYEAHGGCSDQKKHCLTIFSTVWASICYFNGGHYVLVGLSVFFCIVWIISAIFYIKEVNLEGNNRARTFALVIMGLFCLELLLLVVIVICEKILRTQDSTEEVLLALAEDQGKVYAPLKDGE